MVREFDITVKELLAFKIGFKVGQSEFNQDKVREFLREYAKHLGISSIEYENFTDDLIEITMEQNKSYAEFNRVKLHDT